MDVTLEFSGHRADCSWEGDNESVTTYCFGELTEAERERFETHLLECLHCWQEVQRLDAVIRSIQTNRTLTAQFDLEIVTTIGISAHVPRAFFGHKAHCVIAAALYSLSLAFSVFMEIAYAYSRYSALAWPAAAVVLAWAFSTTLGALAADSRVTRSSKRSGLLLAIGVVVFSAAANWVFIGTRLPAFSVTQASFHTWTAQAAYLKGIVYCGVFAAVFLLVPFHFVLVLQRSLWAGKHRVTCEILTGGKFGIPPRGAPYLGVWLLGGLLIMGAVASVMSTAHLLEALTTGPYSNLFILTIVLRWLLFLFLGLECCWWYYTALNDLKRECAAVASIAPGL